MIEGPSAEPPAEPPAGDPLTGEALEEALAPDEVQVSQTGKGAYHRLGVIELWFTQAMVGVMTVLVLASALTRAVGKPQSWTVDMALLTFAWAIFVGADIALRSGRMVSIDLLVDRLPSRVRAVVQLVNSFLIIVFLIAMVGLGAWLCVTTWNRSFSGLPWLSYTWVTLAVPTGCALMLWTALRTIGDDLKQLSAPESGAITLRKEIADAARQGEGEAL